MVIIQNIGSYFLMLSKVFTRFSRWSVMKDLIIREVDSLIIRSVGIVSFISFFVGGVVAIQTALNLTNPLLPKNLIGFATRQSIILEFAPTFISVIMAGKVGSYITSSLGTMKVTEQIDALKVMGINTYNYLIFPKVIAMLFYPFIITISMFLGIFGGYMASIYGGFCTSSEFVEGIQLEFIPYHVSYAFVKTSFFAFILATVPSYHGYFLKGGALDVGKASTTSFVWTSVIIIITNYIITQLLLT
ncbi:MAG: ABC transporter permease [Flavobacteriaceae bacterium]|jgi:phospholipid/cholesterol/gamma-HCH transport system permease protein|nr:ABC transporter permease [Flavobacteriaceae bacterium]OUW73003.1 MAG: ABC transporter permease [Flavobacteriaceae bacterium TMED204]MCH1608668.1 ABC transporter permease [Flavobacteriaceae bacterium]MDG1968094.1 ABC transporter permease [Flavobacteriaceae bacterium]CAI8235097.1 MAG: putative phospholipid ABC transporter permease protein MlaE [Flavobacteriaceae bacterium]|tara:strand:- start:446 stop:1183 length:738 start_codon:yes stop_codon:yes gene_type:complete